MKHSKRLLAVVGLCAMALAWGACEKAPRKLATSTTMPSQVLAVASVASLDQSLAGIAAFANELKPGVGGMISSPMVAMGLAKGAGAMSLMGVAWDKPLHAVVVHQVGAPPAIVLVLTAADAKALREGAGTDVLVTMNGSTALVGRKAPLELVAPWVWGKLTVDAAPAELTVTGYMGNVNAAFGKQIEAGIAQMEAVLPAEQKQIAGMYRGMWEALVADSDAVFMSASASAADATWVMGINAKAGSKLAALAAAQKPNDFSLLRKVPGRGASSFMVGSMAMGPYSDVFMEYVKSMSPGMSAWMPVMEAMMKQDDMQFAGTFTTVTNMQALISVGDEKTAAEVLGKMQAALASAPSMSTSGLIVKYDNVRQSTVSGVGVMSYDQHMEVDPASPQAAVLKGNPMIDMMGKSSFSGAAVGEYMVTAISPIGQPSSIAASIAAVTATDGDAKPFAPEIEAMLARGRDRKESFVMAYDLTAFVPMMLAAGGAPAPAAEMPGPFAPIEIGFGASGGAIQMRFSATSASAKATMAAFGAMGANRPTP
ncbi:MAG: hypothetical protein IPL79_09255 [Myxococcales bacterium]|nr:hypothetical protein [Myxococcales bacterium]